MLQKPDPLSFDEKGYTILKGLLETEEILEIKKEFHEIWQLQVQKGVIIQKPEHPVESVLPRIRDAEKKNRAIQKFVFHPRIISILEQLLQEDVLAVSTSFYFKGPGTRGLPLHQDNYSIGAFPGTTFGVWISLDASDKENGGLYFVPGSHHLGLLTPEKVTNSKSDYGQVLSIPEGYQQVDITTLPGDVIIFDGNILHGSYYNESNHRFRRSLLTHFVTTSVERIFLNYNHLLNKKGERVRRRRNIQKNVERTVNNTEWSGLTLNEN